jgi:hypothetical protein
MHVRVRFPERLILGPALDLVSNRDRDTIQQLIARAAFETVAKKTGPTISAAVVNLVCDRRCDLVFRRDSF